ncbi:hypothetical protein Pmani_010239 [Petrolisthes manimaculis]|uniref:Regulatory protein zeste n=1 Tax=Petrolisthes manimaculis TaxID=1843537 RepID=A0AAE1UFU8_9EUCA|nr:hypothetical protein Pmani_010239 [Petrolisthes manimaculis]
MATAAEPPAKRSRRANFSDEEMMVMITGWHDRQAVLREKFSNIVTAERKKQAWEEVTHEINSVSRGGTSEAKALTPLEEAMAQVLKMVQVSGVPGLQDPGSDVDDPGLPSRAPSPRPGPSWQDFGPAGMKERELITEDDSMLTLEEPPPMEDHAYHRSAASSRPSTSNYTNTLCNNKNITPITNFFLRLACPAASLAPAAAGAGAGAGIGSSGSSGSSGCSGSSSSGMFLLLQ